MTIDHDKLAAILGSEPEPLAGRSPIEAYTDELTMAALRAAYPVLQYYGHKPGEQHFNSSPSWQDANDALELVRAALAKRITPTAQPLLLAQGASR